MSLKVLTQCPKCKKSQQASGKRLSAFSLLTKEGWVVECEYCQDVFTYHVDDIIDLNHVIEG